MSWYRNIGPEDGWSKPIYADEYGNIVPEEVVLAEERKEQLKREIKRELKEDEKRENVLKGIGGVPGSHVYFESEELRKQVEAEVAALPPLPPPEPIETDLNPSVKKHLDAILDTLGYVMVKKEEWEAKLDRLDKLEEWYSKAENRSRGDGHF